MGAAPSPSTVASIAARRLPMLVPIALIHDAMTYTPLALLIGGMGAGDVPGARPEPRSILAAGMLGFYLLTRLIVFPQVVVAEGGLWRPLRRAWALTAGRFWLLAAAKRIAGSMVHPFELAVLTVLYMRLAGTAEAA